MLQEKQDGVSAEHAPFRARLKARDGVRPQSTLAILAGYDPREAGEVAPVTRVRPVARPTIGQPVRPPPIMPSLPALARGPMLPAVLPRGELVVIEGPDKAPAASDHGDQSGYGRNLSQLMFIGIAALGLAGLSFLAADNALKDRIEPQPRDDDHTDVVSASARGEGGLASISAIAVQDVATPIGIEPSPWFDYRGVADYLTARVTTFEAAEREAARLQEMEAERMAAAALADAEAQRLAAAARAIAEEEAGRLAAEAAERQRLAQEEALRIANAQAERVAAQAAAEAAAQAEADRLARFEADRAAAAFAEQQRLAAIQAERAAEIEARRQAEEETRRIAAEAEARRLAEIEAQKAAAAAEERRLADLAAQRAAEEEAARLAALEAQRAAELAEARRLADLEAQRLAEMEAQRAAEENIRLAQLAAQQAAEEEAVRLAALEARQVAEAEEARLAELASLRQAEERATAQRAAEEEAALLAALEAQRAAELAEAQRVAELAALQAREEQAAREAEAAAIPAEAPAITLASAVLVPLAPVAEPPLPPNAASLKPSRLEVVPPEPAMAAPPVARGAPKILSARQPEVRSLANWEQLRSADVFVGDRVQRTAQNHIDTAALNAFQDDFLLLIGSAQDGAAHQMATPDGRQISLKFEDTKLVDASQVKLRVVPYGVTPEGSVTRGYDTPPQVNVSVMCRDVAYSLPGQERGKFSACQTVDGGWLMVRPSGAA